MSLVRSDPGEIGSGMTPRPPPVHHLHQERAHEPIVVLERTAPANASPHAGNVSEDCDAVPVEALSLVADFSHTFHVNVVSLDAIQSFFRRNESR